MGMYYFAKDGSWGEGEDLILVDEDVTEEWTDEMWEEVTEASDSERLELVEKFLEEGE
jgi:hypothetical protein